MSSAQQRTALRHLVVIFGELNSLVELACAESSPTVLDHARTARDMVGDLVADVARPQFMRACVVPPAPAE